MNWFSFEIVAIVSLWAGLIMYYFLCKGTDNPKNLWSIPTLYSMFFTVPAALLDISLGAVTLLLGMVAVMKWSLTNTQS